MRLRLWKIDINVRLVQLSCVVATALLAIGCESRTGSVSPKDGHVATSTPSARSPSATLQPWPPDNRRQDVYVGSSKCAECHQEISDQYFSQHPMGRSLQNCDELNTDAEESLPAKFTAGDRKYGVEFVEKSMRHTEEMLDSSGAIYSQSVEVDFAIGSGTRGYSFVSEVNGCLYQSSATWYSQGKTWDLSPGYSPASHPGFGRRISSECIFCHAGAVNRSINVNRFESPIFAEASIGCERCHGPGNDHVVFHLSGSDSGLVDRIVNPSSLEPSRRDSVCFQCHLHGKDRLLRSFRESFDFRPGDLVSDIWVVLVEEAGRNEPSSQLEAVTQSEQMVASACYKNSKGQLGCISCHTPHGIPDAATKTNFYQGRCLACHEKPNVECSIDLATRLQTSEQDSCIECHMPKASASDVPHTAQTDHRVLKRYSPSVASREPGRLGSFEPTLFPLPREALERAQGLNLEKSMRTKREALITLQLLSASLETGDDVEAIVAASWTMLKMGQMNDAEPLALRAIEIDPENESALEALAIVLQQKGQFNAALQYVQRVLALAPWSYELQAQKAQLLAELDHKQEAISAWHKALEVDPHQQSGRESLIRLLQATNQSAEAETQAAILSRIRAVQQK